MIPIRTGATVAILSLLVAGAGAVAGCADETTRTSSPDEKVLLALDFYDAIYRTDADGRVINLQLDGRHLPDAMMAEIGKLTELDGLCLYAASFTEESLAHLRGLQRLRTLGMGATPITDKALVHLEKLEGLTHIWLPRGRLSPAAVDRFKKARPGLNVYLQ